MKRRLLMLGSVCAAIACASRPSVPPTPPSVTLRAASLSAATDRYFTSAGPSIRYRDAGQGTPVILVHGLTRDLDDWRAAGDSLARTHRVIALDVRGHGKSTRFTDQAKMGRHMTDDVVRLIDHLGVGGVYIAGHSMGAAIAVDAARRYPDKVRGVVLVAGGFSPDPQMWSDDKMGFAADLEAGRGMKRLIQWLFPKLPDSMAAEYSDETMRAYSAAEALAAMRSMDALTIDTASQKPRISAVVVVGSEDPLVPASEWMASWWPGARLVQIDGADHLTVLFRPELVSAIRALARG